MISNGNAPLGCAGPIANASAGSPVTVSPILNVPNDPNTPGLPPDPFSFAAFEVDLKRPETTIAFKYLQNINNPGETAKMVWFGFVKVEVDPARNDRTPPPFDPFTLFGYTPPSAGQAPADPPASNNPGSAPSGGAQGGRGEILNWLGGNIITQIQQSLQTIRAALGGKSLRSFALLPNSYQYNSANGALTIDSLDAAPASGKLTVKVVVGPADAPVKKIARGVAFATGAVSPLQLSLPQNLRKALTKKGKTKVRIIAEFKPASGKVVIKRGTVTLK
jgi:hypothetical protein